MSLQATISGWSRDEKLAAMEFIWRDLSADTDALESPKWHESIIADRLDNPSPGRSLPLQEAKAEVKELIEARRASS